jgi:hypothetical protein
MQENGIMPLVQNHPNIDLVCELFDFTCLFASTEGSSGYWIGNQVESLPGMTAAAVTPVFDTREKLDHFCAEHMGEFRNFAARGCVPSRFWEKPSTELKLVHSRAKLPDVEPNDEN